MFQGLMARRQIGKILPKNGFLTLPIYNIVKNYNSSLRRLFLYNKKYIKMFLYVDLNLYANE